MRAVTPLDLVRRFEEAFGNPTDIPFDKEKLSLRLNLITEEYTEVVEATIEMAENNFDTNSKAHFTKELCDLLYVIYGTAATFGLPILEAFNMVHESNMSKLGADGKPFYREDGKILKGPRYWKPNLTPLFE